MSTVEFAKRRRYQVSTSLQRNVCDRRKTKKENYQSRKGYSLRVDNIILISDGPLADIQIAYICRKRKSPSMIDCDVRACAS